MSYITLKCKNCGANMSLNTESHSATCNHCSSTFLISDLLEEKDTAFLSKFSKSELEQKMLATDAIKQGETYLFKCEFEKAEFSFKKAIELDDSNFRSYLGVVKAKTQNFNKIPDNDDYLQYAHYALSIASGDDLVFVKSELSKINMLEREFKRQKKIHSSILKMEEKNKIRRREISNVFTIITIFIILMIGAFLFISSMFSDIIFDRHEKNLSIDVNSYESLNKVLTHSKYSDYDINLTADIDCDGKTLTPFGTPTKAYSGTFNGNNHTISNAVIDGNDKHYVGLFGYTVLAHIQNLVLDDITLSVDSAPSTTSAGYFGLLVGKCESTLITNIEIKDTCKIDIERDVDYPVSIGGVVGSAINASFISGISSHANFNLNLTHIICPTYSSIGGIAGVSQNAIIQKTCSNSTIYSLISSQSFNTSNVYAGGIVGSILSPNQKDVFNLTYNHFSGNISLNISDNVVYTLSAIAFSGLTSNRNLNNACLYTLTNFYVNSNRIQFSHLSDYVYSENLVEFCTKNDSYLSKLSVLFSEWENSETFTPSLKAV